MYIYMYIYRGGDCLKMRGEGGAWTVCSFKGELGQKEGVVFLRGGGGVDIPMLTMVLLHCFFETCLICSFVTRIEEIIQPFHERKLR